MVQLLFLQGTTVLFPAPTHMESLRTTWNCNQVI